MALYTAWYDDISSDASLLHSAVDHGLRRLGYERIKTEQSEWQRRLLERTHRIWEISGVSQE